MEYTIYTIYSIDQEFLINLRKDSCDYAELDASIKYRKQLLEMFNPYCFDNEFIYSFNEDIIYRNNLCTSLKYRIKILDTFCKEFNRKFFDVPSIYVDSSLETLKWALNKFAQYLEYKKYQAQRTLERSREYKEYLKYLDWQQNYDVYMARQSQKHEIERLMQKSEQEPIRKSEQEPTQKSDNFNTEMMKTFNITKNQAQSLTEKFEVLEIPVLVEIETDKSNNSLEEFEEINVEDCE